MKACPLCNRVYPNSATVCENDGQRLASVRRNAPTEGAPVVDWEGPLAGDIVGNYRLESLIAEGGMGRIFRAAHLTLGRKVAMKFLLPEHASRADLVQRFFNEARSINAIRHPHILEIYDFVQERSTDGTSKVYMVMEYLDGEDVRIRLAHKRRLSPEVVVNIGSQVAEALAAAHEEGILHRDLKPDNIFLCRRPHDFVKLLDFGAAKAFGDRPGHDLTRPGVAIGTPEYMAPEQILDVTLDGRVDAYALGIVLYELLCGKVPFSSPKVADVLAMHTQDEPPPIARRTPEAVEVPAALEEVVLRCLRKNPRDRYADLWQVADALRQSIFGAAMTMPYRAVQDESPTELSGNFELDEDTVPAANVPDAALAAAPPLYLDDKELASPFVEDSCSATVDELPGRRSIVDTAAPRPKPAPRESPPEARPRQQTPPAGGSPALLDLLRESSGELERGATRDEDSGMLLLHSDPPSSKQSTSWMLAVALIIISLATIAVVVWW